MIDYQDLMSKEEIDVLPGKLDVKSFEKLYKEFYSGLCAFASQYVGDDCEEIVQDAMMWFWENRDTLDTGMPLKSLLFTIVRNKCLNSLAHIKVRSRVHEELYQKFEAGFDDPDFYVEKELMARLDLAIENLPKDYCAAFKMNRFEDMTYQEIAEKEGVSSKTIAYRIGQSLKILRVELKEYLPLLLLILKVYSAK